jgi:thioredoxin-like negative regulator of GroEL
MRTRWLLVAALLGVSAASPVRAGVYFPADPTPWPLPTNPRHFEDVLGERKSVATTNQFAKDKPSLLRKHVEDIVNKLAPKRRQGKLTVEESINLGASYILLQKPNDAIEVLENAKAQYRGNFMVLANLAAAYHALNEFTRAAELMREALDYWPRQYKGFTAEQLRWYRRAEEAYRDLLKARASEGPQRLREVRLDPLFKKAHALGIEENYSANQIDPEIAKELPPDALPLVKQLLLWLPHDQRLLWLYAELLNAQGQADIAVKTLNQLVDTGFSSNAVKAHRTVLLEATTPPPPDEVPWSPEWRSVLVGLGTGVLVGVLLVLQFLQFRRWWSRPKPKPAALAASRDGNIGEDRPAVGRGTP